MVTVIKVISLAFAVCACFMVVANSYNYADMVAGSNDELKGDSAVALANDQEAPRPGKEAGGKVILIGASYAAGLSIRSDQISDFREAFKHVAKEMLTHEDLVQKFWVDAEIFLPEITPQLVHLLNEFAPFGPQNMRPIFLSRNLQVVGTPRIVGKNHLKFRVRQSGQVFDAIGFDLGSLLYRLTPGENNLDMIYVVEENQWNRQTKIQLRVKDLR